MDPCLAASLRTCLEDVSVPRSAHACRYPLTSMLFLALTAVIGGADTWVEEFERWLCLPHGIPFHDTFGQVSALLDPELLDARFARWVQTLHGLLTGQVVDLDSKTIRRLHDRNHGRSALHTVSAGLVPCFHLVAMGSGPGQGRGILDHGLASTTQENPSSWTSVPAPVPSKPKPLRHRSSRAPLGPRTTATGHPLGATRSRPPPPTAEASPAGRGPGGGTGPGRQVGGRWWEVTLGGSALPLPKQTWDGQHCPRSRSRTTRGGRPPWWLSPTPL